MPTRFTIERDGKAFRIFDSEEERDTCFLSMDDNTGWTTGTTTKRCTKMWFIEFKGRLHLVRDSEKSIMRELAHIARDSTVEEVLSRGWKVTWKYKV